MSLPYRVVQLVRGDFDVSTYGPETDFVAAMELRGFKFVKLSESLSTRPELRGQPMFAGVLLGPMWDGDAIRYEDARAYEALSI